MKQSFTPIASLGEFGLIERIKELLDVQVDPSLKSQLIKGISDDAAVYMPTEGTVQFVTTDAFAEGIHFDLTYTSPAHLGWKVMSANFSDIAAMGGVPKYAVISLALPSKIGVEYVEEFYKGIRQACAQYSCLLIGGDTIGSPANMFISVTVIGEGRNDTTMYRHGVQIGDLFCVSGTLGGSHAGLKILQQEKQRYNIAAEKESFQPNLEPYTFVLEKHLMPKPRFDVARALVENRIVHAMIDISDGLASEVHHLCNQSNVGAAIEQESIPLHEMTKQVAIKFSENPVDYALFGGEDYELLFTVAERDLPALVQLVDGVKVVGRALPRNFGIELIKPDGESVHLPMNGWNHFS